MNEIQIFNNEQFGKIRTIQIDNEPYFVGKDVAEILGYKDTSDAMKKHIDQDDKLKRRFADSGQNREMYIINESGLYSLIMSSKLPTARQFKRWVTSEVLPAIRKHGVYMTDQKAYDITHNPNSLADLLLQAGEQLKQKDLIIQEMKPKAVFADAVATSKNSILIGELAKILKQNGYNTGQNRLFTELRDRGYLIRRNGVDRNMPTQMAMELGLFEIKETVVSHSDGHTSINKTVKVTGKGQQYFINLFLKQNRDLPIVEQQA